MELFEMIKLLSDETRFKIVELLSKHDLCVGALAEELKISDAAVSQHLQLLRRGGLIKGEKRGYWTHYSVEKKVLDATVLQWQQFANLSLTRQCRCNRNPQQATSVPDKNKNFGCCKGK
jgi:DNA-binding transcriptional ArsR family regulator